MKASGSVEDRLYQTIAEVLGVVPGALSEESSPETIASWDSLNHLNLAMALESEFGVSISPDEAIGMRNVGSIRNTLRGRGARV